MNGTDIPAIFTEEHVRALAIAQMQRWALEINLRNAQVYEQAYKNVELNWRAKRVKIPHPDPAPALAVRVEGKEIVLYETGEPVVPKKPDPWDVEENHPEAPVVFGPELIPGTGILAAAGSTAPAGTEVEHNGKQYVLVQIGQPGSIAYCRVWVPKGYKFP